MNLIKNGRLKKDDEHAREVWKDMADTIHI